MRFHSYVCVCLVTCWATRCVCVTCARACRAYALDVSYFAACAIYAKYTGDALTFNNALLLQALRVTYLPYNTPILAAMLRIHFAVCVCTRTLQWCISACVWVVWGEPHTHTVASTVAERRFSIVRTIMLSGVSGPGNINCYQVPIIFLLTQRHTTL